MVAEVERGINNSPVPSFFAFGNTIFEKYAAWSLEKVWRYIGHYNRTSVSNRFTYL